jgi:hypothetical protein
MTSTYLSIDIDYWDLAKTAVEAKDLFRKLFKLGIPLAIVEDHDGLLEFADKSRATKLINVDYHSDYANFTEKDFKDDVPNCGTWIDHVKRLKEFEWHYPSFRKCFRAKEGRCESWSRRENDATRFWRTGVSRRGHFVSHKQGLKNLPYSRIVAAGVAVSPEYWNNEYIEEEIFMYLYGYQKHFKYVEPCVARDWRDHEDTCRRCG